MPRQYLSAIKQPELQLKLCLQFSTSMEHQKGYTQINFTSRHIKRLCDLYKIKKSGTTPYHSMGNVMPKRFNRTLLDILGTLHSDKKKDWKRYVATLVHAYNSTWHESTRYAPFSLMVWRETRLPIY